MDIQQSSAAKKIAEQAKKDIEILRKALEFVHDEEFKRSGEIALYPEQLIGAGGIEYILWAHLNFNGKQYIEFLKQFTVKEWNEKMLFWGNFKKNPKKLNYRHLEILDRVDYSIKFLSKKFDILLPSKMNSEWNNQVVSVRNSGYYLEEIVNELEIFINRIINLLTNINRLTNNNEDKNEQHKTEWIEKLTKNKHVELLSEMIKFYQINQEKDKFFKLILLKQRLFKLKDESQLSTRANDEMDIELNKITKAILEIMA